jgi:hypothetical protein
MLAPFRVPLADNLSGFDLDAAIAMGGDDSPDALVKAIGAVDLGFDCGSDCGELVGVGHVSLRWRLVVFHFRDWFGVVVVRCVVSQEEPAPDTFRPGFLALAPLAPLVAFALHRLNGFPLVFLGVFVADFVDVDHGVGFHWFLLVVCVARVSGRRPRLRRRCNGFARHLFGGLRP